MRKPVTMQRRHFQLIADVIARQYRLALTAERMSTLHELAYAMADELARTNTAFDSGRFLVACGVWE
jgi:hypothetical protein